VQSTSCDYLRRRGVLAVVGLAEAGRDTGSLESDRGENTCPKDNTAPELLTLQIRLIFLKRQASTETLHNIELKLVEGCDLA
jgi:hypothetical protein